MNTDVGVTGRYAPSPTGDLHLGNLRTALLAWLHARLQGGAFLMRMEDIDAPRVIKGSDARILRDLERLGLDWDGEVVYQSHRLGLYAEVLASLSERGLTYSCFCSRKDIQLAASAPHGAPGVYPGSCRDLTADQASQRALKKMPAVRVRVADEMQCDCGDFVVRRADGLFAYQLVVVVDDFDQGVTEVIRGADLASSTQRQQYLLSLIGGAVHAIDYHHAPLMLGDDGKRMSKRDGSLSLTQWLGSGKTPEALIATLAQSVGLLECDEPLTATQLLSQVSLEQVRQVFYEQRSPA